MICRSRFGADKFCAAGSPTRNTTIVRIRPILAASSKCKSPFPDGAIWMSPNPRAAPAIASSLRPSRRPRTNGPSRCRFRLVRRNNDQRLTARRPLHLFHFPIRPCQRAALSLSQDPEPQSRCRSSLSATCESSFSFPSFPVLPILHLPPGTRISCRLAPIQTRRCSLTLSPVPRLAAVQRITKICFGLLRVQRETRALSIGDQTRRSLRLFRVRELSRRLGLQVIDPDMPMRSAPSADRLPQTPRAFRRRELCPVSRAIGKNPPARVRGSPACLFSLVHERAARHQQYRQPNAEVLRIIATPVSQPEDSNHRLRQRQLLPFALSLNAFAPFRKPRYNHPLVGCSRT